MIPDHLVDLAMEAHARSSGTSRERMRAALTAGISIPGIQCCAQCEEPKFPHHQETGGEKAFGWPGCVNPQCRAYGEQQCSVAFRDPLQTALILQKRINELREWITENGGRFVFEEQS